MPTSDSGMIRSPLFATYGLHAVFTTRQGGVSLAPGDSFNFAPSDFNPPQHVAKNLQRLIQFVPLPCTPKRLQQVHGCKIIHYSRDTANGQSADALFTSEENLPLAIQTADCLPILLADPEHGLIAAVHAGWRGTASGIVAQTVEIMLHYGACNQRLIASLGPCIGPCCFEIDDNCANALHVREEHCPHLSCHGIRWRADLAAMNHAQLLQQGLQEQHIERLDTCTACHPEHFFSYRRDQGRTGRHLAVVVRPSST